MTLSRNVAYSVMWDQIRVNHINPGWTDTPGEDVIRSGSIRAVMTGWKRPRPADRSAA